MFWESETLTVCFLFLSNCKLLTLSPSNHFRLELMCLIVWNNTITWLSDFQALTSWGAVNFCTCLGPFLLTCCQVWGSKQTLLCCDTRLLAGTSDQIPLNAVVVTLTPCSLIRPSCQTWVWTCIMSLLLQHVNLPDILYYVMALKRGPLIYRGKLTWYSAWCHATHPGRLPVCCYFIAIQLCNFRKTLLQQSHLRELLVGNLVAIPLKYTVTICVQLLLYVAVTMLLPSCMIIVLTLLMSKIPASFLANYFLLE